MRVLALVERTAIDVPGGADEAERELTIVVIVGLEDPCAVGRGVSRRGPLRPEFGP